MPPLLHRRVVLYAGLETYVAVSVFRPASLRSAPLQPDVRLVRLGWPCTSFEVTPVVEFGRPGAEKAANAPLHTPVHARTAFPAPVLLEFETASQAHAERCSRLYGFSVVPLATHLVRIPTSTGDGYFRLVMRHAFVGERTLTARTALFRIASLSPPWGAPRSAPFATLIPEIALALWGWGLLIVLGFLRRLIPLCRAVRAWTPANSPSPAQLSVLGVRTGVIAALDQEYGRGGVTYWR